jgi:hypothetical protein
MLVSDDNIRVAYVDNQEIDNKKIVTTYVAYNMKYQGQYLINDMENYKDLWVVNDIYREVFDGEKISDRRKIEIYYSPKNALDEVYEISSAKHFIEGVSGYRTDWYDRDNKRFSYKTIETGDINSYGYRKYEWVYYKQRFLNNNEEYQGPLKDEKIIKEVIDSVRFINETLKEKNQEKDYQKTLAI